MALLKKDKGVKVVACSNLDIAMTQIKKFSDKDDPIKIMVMHEDPNNIYQVKTRFPTLPILVLSEESSKFEVQQALQAGASSYLVLENLSSEVLLRSMRLTIEGFSQINTDLLYSVVNGYTRHFQQLIDKAGLTSREIEVLNLLSAGESNLLISETLNISLDTTKKHVRNLIQKMGARNRVHLAVIASHSGSLTSPFASNIVPLH